MEEVSDPFLDDRVMKNVLPPPRFPMDHQKLFPKKNQPDWKALKTHLTKEGRLAKSDVIELINVLGKHNNNLTAVGRYYGVSDSAVKKWKKLYMI